MAAAMLLIIEASLQKQETDAAGSLGNSPAPAKVRHVCGVVVAGRWQEGSMQEIQHMMELLSCQLLLLLL